MDIDETSWDEDKHYYVGNNPKDSDFVVVDAWGNVYKEDIITTQDPNAKENKPLLIHNGIEWSEDTIKSMIDKHTK